MSHKPTEINRLILWLKNASVTRFQFMEAGEQEVCKPKYLLTSDRDLIVRLLIAERERTSAALAEAERS